MVDERGSGSARAQASARAQKRRPSLQFRETLIRLHHRIPHKSSVRQNWHAHCNLSCIPRRNTHRASAGRIAAIGVQRSARTRGSFPPSIILRFAAARPLGRRRVRRGASDPATGCRRSLHSGEKLIPLHHRNPRESMVRRNWHAHCIVSSIPKRYTLRALAGRIAGFIPGRRDPPAPGHTEI
jgi:hypothetical protein